MALWWLIIFSQLQNDLRDASDKWLVLNSPEEKLADSCTDMTKPFSHPNASMAAKFVTSLRQIFPLTFLWPDRSVFNGLELSERPGSVGRLRGGTSPKKFEPELLLLKLGLNIRPTSQLWNWGHDSFSKVKSHSRPFEPGMSLEKKLA